MVGPSSRSGRSWRKICRASRQNPETLSLIPPGSARVRAVPTLVVPVLTLPGGDLEALGRGLVGLGAGLATPPGTPRAPGRAWRQPWASQPRTQPCGKGRALTAGALTAEAKMTWKPWFRKFETVETRVETRALLEWSAPARRRPGYPLSTLPSSTSLLFWSDTWEKSTGKSPNDSR